MQVKRIRERALAVIRNMAALGDPPPSAIQVAHIMKESGATVSSELCRMARAGLVKRAMVTGPLPLRVSWRYTSP